MNPLARWLWTLWTGDSVETETPCTREASDLPCWCPNCRAARRHLRAVVRAQRQKHDGKNADKRHAR